MTNCESGIGHTFMVGSWETLPGFHAERRRALYYVCQYCLLTVTSKEDLENELRKEGGKGGRKGSGSQNSQGGSGKKEKAFGSP